METEQGHDGGALAEQDPALQRWVLNPDRSSLKFNLRHIVVGQIRGRFERWGGAVFVDAHEPWLSSATIWIDPGSVSTGNGERDTQVRSAEFLDVVRFPQAEFKSTNITVRGSKVILVGRLTLHGVTRDVEVAAEIGAVVTDAEGRAHAQYVARAIVDRQSFGLHWNQDLDVGGVVVGDEVEIVAEVDLVHEPAGRR